MDKQFVEASSGLEFTGPEQLVEIHEDFKRLRAVIDRLKSGAEKSGHKAAAELSGANISKQIIHKLYNPELAELIDKFENELEDISVQPGITKGGEEKFVKRYMSLVLTVYEFSPMIFPYHSREMIRDGKFTLEELAEMKANLEGIPYAAETDLILRAIDGAIENSLPPP